VKISELKPFQDGEVTLHLNDGEVLLARMIFVDLEYVDIVVDVNQTSKPEHYKDPSACYTVAASDVVSLRASG
jgi:hypothetical protein